MGIIFFVALWLGILGAPDVAYDIATTVYLAVSFWVMTAIFAKRWHDIGKSGWWTLLVLIPFAWPIVLLYLGIRETETTTETSKVRSPFLEDTQ
jgi:uncharacterized membrane protein YhaH (DUF805 family)